MDGKDDITGSRKRVNDGNGEDGADGGTGEAKEWVNGADGDERCTWSRCMASIARRRGGDPEKAANILTEGETETFPAANR